jgi:phage gp16-like protein
VPDAGYHEAWQSELQKRLNEVKDQSVNLASTKSVIADMRKEQL